ncbi:MAG: sulfite exporter TauE/SafE family protein [Bacteroidia bacterium]|nr:sulfite exporter TauE/SafE family protein [Bacteroidia bacterium]
MFNDALTYFFIGVFAQLIDGAFGMAFGIMTTSLLIYFYPNSISPAVASAVMHFSEIFNTGYSSYVYKKNRLINKSMYKAMFFPAVIGAVAGAILISIFSKSFANSIKPLMAIYFLVISVIICFRAFRLFEKRKRWMSVPLLAWFGAFMDSIGGGGWGALVTSALIVGGRDMRSTIGTSHAIKFVVVMVSSVTFITMLGIQHLWIVLWVTLGSVISVPLSIYLNNKIPKKWGLLVISIILFLIAIKTLYQNWI